MHALWSASLEGWMRLSWIRLESAQFVWIQNSAIHAVNWRLVWITVVAFVAGMMNAVAGGGSLLSFPAMLGIGLGPIEANATNTLALWPGQFASIAGYWGEIRKLKSMAVWMGLAGLSGGAIGATLLLRTPAGIFMKLVPWLLLTAALIFAFSGPWQRHFQQRKQAHSVTAHPSDHAFGMVFLTMLICFYIGYFGAGAGFLLIAMMTLFGLEDLHQMNALKVVATTMANGVACLLFILGGKVVWQYCLAAMITCAMGGYVASRSAKRLNPRMLRSMVVVLGFVLAAYFFWKSY